MVVLLFIIGGFKVDYIFYLSNYTPGISYTFVTCYFLMTFICFIAYRVFLKNRSKVIVSAKLIREEAIRYIMLGFKAKLGISYFSIIISLLNTFTGVSSPFKVIGNYISYYIQPFFNVSMYKMGESWVGSLFVGGTGMHILSGILLTLYSIFIMYAMQYIVRRLICLIEYFVNHHLSTFTIPSPENKNVILRMFEPGYLR